MQYKETANNKMNKEVIQALVNENLRLKEKIKTLEAENQHLKELNQTWKPLTLKSKEQKCYYGHV